MPTTKTKPKKSSTTILPAKSLARLRELFGRNGYILRQDPDRVVTGQRVYKKGDEVRMVAENRTELTEIRRLLKQAGFKMGRPFTKGAQFRQPIYGRDQTDRFAKLMKKR